MIIPDLPLDLYESTYRRLFETYDLHLVFLVTPATSTQRIQLIDKASHSFIYAVSSASTTGSRKGISGSRDYLSRLQVMELKHPFLVGFNIATAADYAVACNYGKGAIIGSAFIKAISGSDDLEKDIESFIDTIKNPIAS